MQANRSSGRRRLLIAAGAVAAVLPLCLTGSATAAAGRPTGQQATPVVNPGTTSGTTGFGAARRHITDSNLGNEGAYDGLSGVALTLAEYHALLDWYRANGTYPRRTLKVTLLDASRGKTVTGLFTREGS